MFERIQKKMREGFDKLVASGQLYTIEVDRDKIWDVYLQNIPEEFRQSDNCQCCRSFLRQYGGIVGVSVIDAPANRAAKRKAAKAANTGDNLNTQNDTNIPNNPGKQYKISSLWDFWPELSDEDDVEYKAAIKGLQEYVLSQPVSGLFLNTFPKCGTEKSPDPKRNLTWNHFYFELPRAFVKRESEIGPFVGSKRDDKNVLERSLKEITPDAVSTVLELISQNSLYRGNEHKFAVETFQTTQKEYLDIKNNKEKEAFCWFQAAKTTGAVCRIKNTSIGTLLSDLSEGKDIDDAVKAFERVVAPANYKRPTAIITPKMIENAKKRLEELGLIGALNRRALSEKDLNVNNSLFVYRAQKKGADIFEQLKEDSTVNPKSLSKVEEVTITDFINKILPNIKSIKLLLENRHLGNFVTLLGPQDKDSGNLFKWDNQYSWSYSGSVADSIAERVKSAGGTVDGILRISLGWSNFDDLDLRVIEPSGYEIYYGNKGRLSPSNGLLDVDMNAGYATSRNPVENIFWKDYPKQEGNYQIVVNQFNRRESNDTGFTVEIEYENEVQVFSYPENGLTGHNHKILTLNYSRKNGIQLSQQGSTNNKYCSREKWGLKTGLFHKVKSFLLSPNHWSDKGIGNKHFMFMLEGCKSEESARGWYNEFLDEKLSPDRRVFEMLANKVTVEPSENELSGLGFSETIRNDVYLEVEGAFKRIIKIKI